MPLHGSETSLEVQNPLKPTYFLALVLNVLSESLTLTVDLATYGELSAHSMEKDFSAYAVVLRSWGY